MIRKESGFFQIVYILILNNIDLSMKKGSAISSIQHACMVTLYVCSCDLNPKGLNLLKRCTQVQAGMSGILKLQCQCVWMCVCVCLCMYAYVYVCMFV